MAITFPNVSEKLGLGVGLDMPWGDPFGFNIGENRPAEKVLNFIDRYSDDFKYGFISCHPKSRGKLKSENYIEAFSVFFDQAKNFKARALHHTFLNLGAIEPYDKDLICDFTNDIIEEFNIKWINEDLGIWSIRGKTLPYPLPPYLTNNGLKACIKNIEEYQLKLKVPVLIEFPGFTDGTNFFIGRIHAFDYFNKLVRETNSPITLDTGHIISYQWLLGKRGEDLYSDLDRLPLEHCFEIHLSGCQIVKDKFMDFHHGVIMDEQIKLLSTLIPLCPNLKAITYEDPKFDNNGVIISKAKANYLALKKITEQWEKSA